MSVDRLMKICLTCDHCRMKFDTSEELVEGDDPIDENHPRFDVTVSSLFNRDNINEIYCRKGAIRNHLGIEKRFYSQTPLISAKGIEGTCPYYTTEEEDEQE